MYTVGGTGRLYTHRAVRAIERATRAFSSGGFIGVAKYAWNEAFGRVGAGWTVVACWLNRRV